MENGSFSYVVTNRVKVAAVVSQKLLPVTDMKIYVLTYMLITS